MPALVTFTVTGLVEPLVAGMSAPDDGVSNFCATPCGAMCRVSPASAYRHENHGLGGFEAALSPDKTIAYPKFKPPVGSLAACDVPDGKSGTRQHRAA